MFPEKVWEWTATSPTGRPLWSSRPKTPDDRERRAAYTEGFEKRQAERERLGIRWFQIGSVEDGTRRRG